MNDRIDEIIIWTTTNLVMYYRDTNLSQSIIDKFKINKIIRSKTFVDVSNLKSQPTTNCRMLISSSKAAPVYKFNPDTEKWGLNTINCNSYFKVLDAYIYEGITQIFLLHIPAKGIDLFNQKLGLENELIKAAREDLHINMAKEKLPALQEKPWIERTKFPIGLDSKNIFFSLDVTEPLFPMAKPMYSAIKKMTNDLSDINEAPIQNKTPNLEDKDRNKEIPKKEKIGFFKRLFGKKEVVKKEEKTTKDESPNFLTRKMSKSDIENLKVGDTLTLGQITNQISQTKYNPKWIEAKDNPFNVRIFDCREYAINMISSTKNQEIVHNFLQSRKSNGQEYIGKFPEGGAKCNVELNFNTKGKKIPDGILFKAQKMESKWDIYKYADFIFFVRSWTAELVYVCNYIPTEAGFKVNLVVLDERKINQNDPHFEFKVLEFLIRSHILGLQVPHPLPKELKNENEAILGYSYSIYGNRGYYGYYS